MPMLFDIAIVDTFNNITLALQSGTKVKTTWPFIRFRLFSWAVFEITRPVQVNKTLIQEQVVAVLNAIPSLKLLQYLMCVYKLLDSEMPTLMSLLQW